MKAVSQDSSSIPSKPNGVYRRTQASSAKSLQESGASREKLKPFLVAAGLAAVLAALAEACLLLTVQH
ncbi:hypothetical protein WJX84_001626 [Apatococcus fuscideae]